MASAFDCISSHDASYVKSALWSGESMASIAKEWGIKARDVARMRDELFSQFASPEAVIAAANGPLINACSLNKPKARRTRKTGPKPIQTEMFQA